MPVSSAVSARLRALAALRRIRHDWVCLAFAAMVVAGTVHELLPPGLLGQQTRNVLFTAVVAAYFMALLTCIVLSAIRTNDRRLALLLLAAGVLLWAIGSATLTVHKVSEIKFPAPGESFFLASYIGLAAFLLMEVSRRERPALGVWLEAAVVCGAAACLAALLAIPLSDALDSAVMAPLLLALLYPLLDFILAIVVMGQVLLGQRACGARTATLAGGFALLAVADSSFLLTIDSGTYADSPALHLAYGLSFALIVGAARRRPPEVLNRRDDRNRSRVLVVAAAVAIAALVFDPGDDPFRLAITLAAVLTLAAAGWRLVLALREARGAAEALRLSRTDELTGLPNRRAVLQDLEATPANGGPLALLLLDLDGFKEINDSLGHAVGDRVLVQVADRLRTRLGHQLDVARLGGDEFALTTRRSDPIGLTELGREVCAVLAEQIEVDGLELSISASIGIAIRSADTVSASDLLRRADVAMYEAKANRAGSQLYEPSHDNFTRARLRRGEQLRRGIREGELALWYQPQVDAATQQVIAVEALVRWQHPTEGLLTPATFLPEARRYGLMPALSLEVIRQAVADARRWIDEGLRFRVAVNCAPPELLGGPLLARLYEAMKAAELPPD
ncbi:MAG: diguanylate cyclase, partial [Nocardioidaceae bacterium]|nr:diguanylate cyclase [Nocardioidaceae bacterium]